MPEIVVVTGSSTGVGKTWTTAGLVRALAPRLETRVCKPVESFAPGEVRDSEVLADAAGVEPDRICPPHRRYELPLAPPMAAERLGRPSFTIADLVAEMALADGGVELVLVEGAGGPYSPLASDGDTIALARRLGAGTIVSVVDAGLGAINASLATSAAFPGTRIVTFLNRFEPRETVHVLNREWLATRHHEVYDRVADLARALSDGTGTLTPHGDT